MDPTRTGGAGRLPEVMQPITTRDLDHRKLDAFLSLDPAYPHIHSVDLPYRMASIWQDHACEMGLWERSGRMEAWALFQPAWWNLDFAAHPALRGSDFELEIFAWGKEQMAKYAKLTGSAFRGSIELFEESRHADRTIRNLESAGFSKFSWSILRFERNLDQTLPNVPLPAGFRIRPLKGLDEVQAYVDLHRAAFGSRTMTVEWRTRTLKHPAYRPELDLVLENDQHIPVGFCVCWQREDAGQIEPLGVHPDYQGLGLGKALEAHAFQLLMAQGVRLIKVDHASSNEQAIALSRRSGFRQTNNALRFYIDVK